MAYTSGQESSATPEHRSVALSMTRGLLCRCPKCGIGRLFCSFLKVDNYCGHCHEELFHHRADDFPAYIDMVIVGHVSFAAAMAVPEDSKLPLWLIIMSGCILTGALALILLQPIKGAVVGLQWANRIHGFGHPEEDGPRWRD